MSWDPEVAPDPTTWLALDEATQAEAVARWHEAHPSPALHPPGLEPRTHAALHAAVERQLASDDPPAVGRALHRLQEAGLRRHPALHAIMDTLLREMRRSLLTGQPFDTVAYERQLDALRPEEAIPLDGIGWMSEDDPS